MKVNPITLHDIRFKPESKINHSGSFFDVSFHVQCTDGEQGIEHEHLFEITIPVPSKGNDEPWEVMESGLQALPTFFRRLADEVDVSVQKRHSSARMRKCPSQSR